MIPPPGILYNLENSENHDAANIALHTVCLFLVTFFMAVRMYTRAFISHWLSWDDCKLSIPILLVFVLIISRCLPFGICKQRDNLFSQPHTDDVRNRS